MLKVGEVFRPYQPLSTHVAKQATAVAHIKAHVADAVAAPRPSANEDPRLKRNQAQLRSIGMKTTPTKGQPVPNTQSMATNICWRNRAGKVLAKHPPARDHTYRNPQRNDGTRLADWPSFVEHDTITFACMTYALGMAPRRAISTQKRVQSYPYEVDGQRCVRRKTCQLVGTRGNGPCRYQYKIKRAHATPYTSPQN